MIDTHVHLYPDDVIWRFYVWIEKKHKFTPGMRIEWKEALKKLREMGVDSFFNRGWSKIASSRSEVQTE